MDVCIERLRLGDNVALFPEGTCNETDPTRVQPLGSGIGHIVHAADKEGFAPVLAYLGLTYGNAPASYRSPTFFFDTPARILPDDPEAIVRSVSVGMQKALDGAIALHGRA